jgi:23S rRNA pseudouridine2605 synthase
MAQVRLQKLLAQAGVASRRGAEELIRNGEVTVSGAVVRELGIKVDPEVERVELRGKRMRPEAPQYRILLKPRACLATLAPSAPDNPERRTLERFLPDVKAHDTGRASPDHARRGSAKEPSVATLTGMVWKVVAPLDFLAEGVVLLTTDGALAERMSRGGGRVPMTYHLKMQGRIGDEEIARLLRGWKWDGRPVKPASAETIATTGKNTWIEMVVAESRPRVLKAVGETIRHTILKISRVKLGGISFEGLKMGGFRDLTKKEVQSLLAQAGMTKG